MIQKEELKLRYLAIISIIAQIFALILISGNFDAHYELSIYANINLLFYVLLAISIFSSVSLIIYASKKIQIKYGS